MTYCERQKRCVDWAAPTLVRLGAELHYTPEGWDVMIPSGPMQGWHVVCNGFELAKLADQLWEMTHSKIVR